MNRVTVIREQGGTTPTRSICLSLSTVESGKVYMKKCETPACTSTNLVYSGTDAFAIAGGGAPTERFCYTCLSAFALIRDVVSAPHV